MSRLSWCRKRTFLKKNVMAFFQAESSALGGKGEGGREGGRDVSGSIEEGGREKRSEYSKEK